MKVFKYVFMAFVFLFSSCNDDEEGTPLSSLKYRLYLPESYDINIQYYSDQYFASKELKSFNLNSVSYTPPNEGYWEGKHLQNDKETGYYINVNFNQLASFSGDLKLYIYANDSIVIDSVSYNASSSAILLEGQIPVTF